MPVAAAWVLRVNTEEAWAVVQDVLQLCDTVIICRFQHAAQHCNSLSEKVTCASFSTAFCCLNCCLEFADAVRCGWVAGASRSLPLNCMLIVMARRSIVFAMRLCIGHQV